MGQGRIAVRASRAGAAFASVVLLVVVCDRGSSRALAPDPAGPEDRVWIGSGRQEFPPPPRPDPVTDIRSMYSLEWLGPDGPPARGHPAAGSRTRSVGALAGGLRRGLQIGRAGVSVAWTVTASLGRTVLARGVDHLSAALTPDAP